MNNFLSSIKKNLDNLFGFVQQKTMTEPLADNGPVGYVANKYADLGDAVATTPEQIAAMPEYIGRMMSPQNQAEEIVSPLPTNNIPQPTATPTIPPRTFDFANYVSGPGTENLTQPPEDVAKVLWDIFGPRNEATQAATVAAAEHLNNPWQTDAIGQNYDESGNPTSKDYGFFQDNSDVFNDLLQRRSGQMEAIQPDMTLEDLLNLVVNAKVAELTRKDEEWDQSQGFVHPDTKTWRKYGKVGQPVQDWEKWYGWQDKGWELKNQ